MENIKFEFVEHRFETREIAEQMKQYGFDEPDIVTLEVAKQLKQCGFNKPTYFFYIDENVPCVKRGLHRIKHGNRRLNHNKYNEFIYSAPSKEELIKYKLI